jgi:hypothetical protein
LKRKYRWKTKNCPISFPPLHRNKQFADIRGMETSTVPMLFF